MLRRLLSFLLVLCLAVPAVAAPAHCDTENSPPAMVEHSAHSGHAAPAPSPAPDHPMPDDAQAKHECIGCVVPTTSTDAIAAAEVLRGPARVIALVQHLTPSHSAPDLPPPRL